MGKKRNRKILGTIAALFLGASTVANTNDVSAQNISKNTIEKEINYKNEREGTKNLKFLWNEEEVKGIIEENKENAVTVGLKGDYSTVKEAIDAGNNVINILDQSDEKVRLDVKGREQLIIYSETEGGVKSLDLQFKGYLRKRYN